MQTENAENMPDIGEIKKRRETMADGRRYMIYYTFENRDEAEGETNDELKSENQNSSFLSPLASSFSQNV